MGSLNISNEFVLIFGGEDDESNALPNCYSFDGENFEKRPSLPDVSSTFTFDGPGIVNENRGYIYSTAGVLFSVDLETFEWTEIETYQEFTNRI